MVERVCKCETREQSKHNQVAPVLSSHDFAQDEGGQNDRKRQIDRRGHANRQVVGNQNGDTTSNPEQCKRGQWPPNNWKPTRPVGNGSQKETRQHCAQISKKEFMCVPGHGIKPGWQLKPPGEGSKPDQHSDQGPCRPKEKKRTEPVAEEGRACPCAHLLCRTLCHDRELSVSAPASATSMRCRMWRAKYHVAGTPIADPKIRDWAVDKTGPPIQLRINDAKKTLTAAAPAPNG